MNRLRSFIIILVVLTVVPDGSQAGVGGFLRKQLRSVARDAAPTPTAQPTKAPAEQPASQQLSAVFDLLKRVLGQGPQQIALDDERSFGEAITALMARAYGGRLLDQTKYAAVWDYVNTVALAVAPVTIRPDLPSWRVGIVVNPEIGACAGPGGYILLTTGLLTSLTNEAELAGVIAHEMAHICRRHGLHALTSGMKSDSVFGVVGAFASGRMAGLVDNVRSSFSDGVKFKYGSQKEFEADKLAAQWVYRTGYDPTGLAKVVGRLPGGANRAYGNHPSIRSRVAALAAYTNKLPGAAGLPTLEERYGRIVGEALGLKVTIPTTVGN